MRILILLGSFLPFVRREGIWTGFFFFHSAHVIGPSGVFMIVSSAIKPLSYGRARIASSVRGRCLPQEDT